MTLYTGIDLDHMTDGELVDAAEWLAKSDDCTFDQLDSILDRIEGAAARSLVLSIMKEFD